MFPISVNVSRVFLTMSDFVERLDNLLLKYDIEPKYLELEITETIFTDVKIIKAAVSRLREHGFKILMDDFGSAYSSLNVLKEIDFDVLKIDMKFLSNNTKSQTIIKNVINLSNDLNITSLTEGIETESQFNQLIDMGCSLFQGYYFAKPMAITDFEQFVKERRCV
jgi:EAL domain-containing protein (putative c-di-GMP-specific phosphodiesterase class I)